MLSLAHLYSVNCTCLWSRFSENFLGIWSFLLTRFFDLWNFCYLLKYFLYIRFLEEKKARIFDIIVFPSYTSRAEPGSATIPLGRNTRTFPNSLMGYSFSKVSRGVNPSDSLFPIIYSQVRTFEGKG